MTLNQDKRNIILANLLLLGAAFIWGTAFLFQKVATTEIGPILFMASRSIMGSLAVVPIIVYGELRKPREERTRYTYRSFWYLARRSMICGFLNITGNVLVQWGLYYTTASKGGFLNSIFIIFVPLVGLLFFHQKPNKFMWLGILLAAIGLYNLCLDESLTINRGDLIILSSALFFSVNIHLMNKFVKQVNGVHLVCLEFFSAFVYCLIASFIVEEPSFDQVIAARNSILYSGILGVGICYAMQATAQKYADPTVAALLMSLESVFAALGGVLLLGESFTAKEFLGVLFIVSAVVISQVEPEFLRRVFRFGKKSEYKDPDGQTHDPTQDL